MNKTPVLVYNTYIFYKQNYPSLIKNTNFKFSNLKLKRKKIFFTRHLKLILSRDAELLKSTIWFTNNNKKEMWFRTIV